MLRRVCAVLMLLALMTLPSFAVGQDMFPGQWWRLPQAGEMFGLTDKQKLQLDDLYFKNRRNLAELKDALEKERSRFAATMEREPLNEAAVMTQFGRLEETRTRLAAERVHYVIELRKVLGPERFQRVKTYFSKMRDKRSKTAGAYSPHPSQKRGVVVTPWGVMIERR
jgi:Spy/CpxP family protein refolding chaperone